MMLGEPRFLAFLAVILLLCGCSAMSLEEAQYNLALLWDGGLGSTPRNLVEASNWYEKSALQGYVPAMVRLGTLRLQKGQTDEGLSWLVLASRWGNKDAVSALKRFGARVPRPDLLDRQLYENKVAQEIVLRELGQSAFLIGCAIAGNNCNASNASSTTNQSLSPEYNPQSPDTQLQLLPSTDKSSEAYVGNTCGSDHACFIGEKCVKEPYESNGICLKAVDAYGVQQFVSPSSQSLGVNVNPQCRVGSDCPVGFRCDSALSACIK